MDDIETLLIRMSVINTFISAKESDIKKMIQQPDKYSKKDIKVVKNVVKEYTKQLREVQQEYEKLND